MFHKTWKELINNKLIIVKISCKFISGIIICIKAAIKEPVPSIVEFMVVIALLLFYKIGCLAKSIDIAPAIIENGPPNAMPVKKKTHI